MFGSTNKTVYLCNANQTKCGASSNARAKIMNLRLIRTKNKNKILPI